jgi:hypothetical protein
MEHMQLVIQLGPGGIFVVFTLGATAIVTLGVVVFKALEVLECKR